MDLISCVYLGSHAQATHIVDIYIYIYFLKVVFDQNVVPRNLLIGTEGNHGRLVTVVGWSFGRDSKWRTRECVRSVTGPANLLDIRIVLF